MNHPHVNKLYYRVKVASDVDYDNAPPISETTGKFKFFLDGDTAVFEMKQHYATIDEARTVAEEYLRAYDVLIGLEQRPDDLKFDFHDADVIDLFPTPPKNGTRSLQARVASVSIASDSVSMRISKRQYPSFPKSFKLSPDAEIMYMRYKAYRQGREPLTSMAYMCLTILEASAGVQKQKRRKAAEKYHIDLDILDVLGTLVSERGSATEARKFDRNNSVLKPLCPNEKEWIDTVIKVLIRRVGEYNFNPQAKLRQISMSDLPTL